MTNEQRIKELIDQHLNDGDWLFYIQLLSIQKGLAQPSAEFVGESWMQELVELCKNRKPRVVVQNHGNAIIVV